jgi:hypothetical protein
MPQGQRLGTPSDSELIFGASGYIFLQQNLGRALAICDMISFGAGAKPQSSSLTVGESNETP